MSDMTVTSAQYQTDPLGNNSNILAVIDGDTVSVAIDTDNRHYQAILDWVAEGNTIADAS